MGGFSVIGIALIWRIGSLNPTASIWRLEAFYDGVVEAIDSIVEVYQGNFGLIGSCSIQGKTPADIVKTLREDAGWIVANRQKISKGLTPVENLLDSLLEIYFQTIYKLQNLT